MNHKERVLTTLNHEQPDRVPFFYWSVPEFTEKMINHFKFSDMDELLKFLDVDFRCVEPDYIGPELRKINELEKTDIWGVKYKLVGKGKLKYWDIDTYPLEGVTDIAVLSDYSWPTVHLFDFFSLDKKLKKYKDYAIMTAPGYCSPGLLRIIQRLVGKSHFIDIVMYHPKFFSVLVEKVSNFYLKFIEEFFKVAGNRVDFIRIADNFGSQSGISISAEMWEDICKPVIMNYYEIPKKIGVKFYMHSNGGIRKLISEFISVGAQVLDPIQTGAAGMTPEGLKKDYGHLITFCGALDEELLLRKATPARVKEGVKELLDIMAPGGGFILGSSHKLKVETPVENVAAMYEAAKEWHY
jgi:uroporphyrinogen decarboxylase